MLVSENSDQNKIMHRDERYERLFHNLNFQLVVCIYIS